MPVLMGFIRHEIIVTGVLWLFAFTFTFLAHKKNYFQKNFVHFFVFELYTAVIRGYFWLFTQQLLLAKSGDHMGY